MYTNFTNKYFYESSHILIILPNTTYEQKRKMLDRSKRGVLLFRLVNVKDDHDSDTDFLIIQFVSTFETINLLIGAEVRICTNGTKEKLSILRREPTSRSKSASKALANNPTMSKNQISVMQPFINFHQPKHNGECTCKIWQNRQNFEEIW